MAGGKGQEVSALTLPARRTREVSISEVLFGLPAGSELGDADAREQGQMSCPCSLTLGDKRG